MKTDNGIIKQEPAEEHLEFPGYPQYSPEEDITNKAKRVDINLDDNNIPVIQIPEDIIGEALIDEDVETDLEPVNESDVTKEDLEALGPIDLSLDMGEDEELLKHRVYPLDFSGKDIDVPGSELDDTNEDIGEEDEENNSYSLGGDRHQDLEEDRS